jgi:hypothetical protein
MGTSDTNLPTNATGLKTTCILPSLHGGVEFNIDISIAGKRQALLRNRRRTARSCNALTWQRQFSPISSHR